MAGALLCGAATVNASPRPAVVELFTSQGCSSCPPADTYLGELTQRRDVLALAFHVDYWDGDGWRDRYAIPQAARRQSSYVHTLGLPSAFTPQVVIDGRTSLVGSNRRGILTALSDAPPGVPLTLEITGDALSIEVPDSNTPNECDVNLVAYLSQASTAVARGENSGRTLTEFNIVRLFAKLGSWKGSARKFSVPRASLPIDANRVAIFLQRANQGAIAGAAAAPLP